MCAILVRQSRGTPGVDTVLIAPTSTGLLGGAPQSTRPQYFRRDAPLHSPSLDTGYRNPSVQKLIAIMAPDLRRNSR